MIKEDLIAEIMATQNSEEKRAFIEAQKKLRSFKLDKNDEAKLFRFLSGRGFATDSINQAISLLKEGFTSYTLH